MVAYSKVLQNNRGNNRIMINIQRFNRNAIIIKNINQHNKILKYFIYISTEKHNRLMFRNESMLFQNAAITKMVYNRMP